MSSSQRVSSVLLYQYQPKCRGSEEVEQPSAVIKYGASNQGPPEAKFRPLTFMQNTLHAPIDREMNTTAA